MKRVSALFKNKDSRKSGSIVELNNTCATELAPGLSTLYSPQMTTKSHIRDAVDVLLELEKITVQQADNIRHEQEEKGYGDVEQLVLKNGVNQDDLLMAKAKLYGFEFRHIEVGSVDKEAFERLDLNYIRSSHVMPVAMRDGILEIATSEPANVFAIDDVKRQTGMNVQVVVTSSMKTSSGTTSTKS